MSLDMDALKSLFRQLIPRVRWAEEQELRDAMDSVDSLEALEPEPTDPGNQSTPAGVKDASGSPFTGLNTSE